MSTDDMALADRVLSGRTRSEELLAVLMDEASTDADRRAARLAMWQEPPEERIAAERGLVESVGVSAANLLLGYHRGTDAEVKDMREHVARTREDARYQGLLNLAGESREQRPARTVKARGWGVAGVEVGR